MYFETLNALSSNITQSVNAPRKTNLRIMQNSAGSKLQYQKDVYYIDIDRDPTVTDRIIENNKWEKRTGSARPFACGKKK